MAKYIIEAQCLVPHLVRYCIEAESEAEALAKFTKMDPDNSLSTPETSLATFWDGQFEDFDNARLTTYANVTPEYGDDVASYEPGERADAGA